MSTTRRGFTLAELLVALAISGIVLGSVYRLMTSQGRGYAQQLALADASETLQGAGALLSWEMRHAEMATDTLFTLSADTLAVRSVQGAGVVCAINATSGLYGIWKCGGDIKATGDDTAMVSTSGGRGWKKLRITQVGTPGGMGLTQCAWAGTRAPDLVVQFSVATARDTAGIVVGSMFRAFRRTRFAELFDSGRWWLGRQVGSAAWEKITGPLLSPAAGGLAFSYYDSTGAATTSASRVRAVGMTMRSETYKTYLGPNGGAPRYRRDSLITRVMVRR